MNEQQIQEIDTSGAAQAVVKRKKSVSIVWIVPLVALLIGGWLAYRAITEKGPTITITFQSAEGLPAKPRLNSKTWKWVKWRRFISVRTCRKLW
jgi:paraquat-inducible protein B